MIPTATVRFSAVFASSSILRLASRQTGTVTRKKKAMTSLSLSADETPTAAVSQPPSHEAVFTTLKKSIGNILGKPASRDGMITETKCNSRSEMNASAPRTVECQREEEEEEEEEHEVENKNKKEPKERDEEESHVTQGVPSYYKPMNMNETLYEGEVAKQLCAMAIAHRFQSPVWATKGSLARFGCTVRDGEEGVSVATMMQTVTLYNLEQTNDCGAAMSSVLRNQEATRWKQREMPLSASGRLHSQRIRCILREHPSYSQYTSPFWVTEEEAVALGTSVLPWQRVCGILIPRRHNRDASSTASASSAPEDENEGKSHPMTHNDTTAEDEGEVLMLYNAAQLVDENKVTRETCPPVEFLSAGGRRYSVLLHVYMRRYCQEYNFSMQPFATFITAQRLRWLGGGILATKNDIPPFTCIIKDEIVSLYHADHTTISAEIAKRARDRQRELLDRITGKTV